MNERMIKLFNQAQEFAYENISKEFWNTDNFHSVVSGKFAELIVSECLEQIYSVTIDNPTDDWDQGYDSGLNQAAETIKTHFGVEE